MESNMSRDILLAANDERQRLEALLQADPTFQKLEAVRRIIELYEPEIAASTHPSASSQESGPQLHLIPDTAPTEVDPPTRAARAWGRQSAQIREESVKYLRQKGEPATGPEICEAIMNAGVEIRGKKPSAVVSAKLSSSPLFEYTRDGYVLREW
jgi:hypothetical protein